jgi:hypothetical protein
MTNPTLLNASTQLYPLPGVTTSSNALTQVAFYAMPTSGVLALDILVKGERTGSTLGAYTARRQVTAVNSAGSISIPVDEVIGTDYNPGGYGGVTVTVVTGGIAVNVTGPVSTPVRWSVAALAVL